MSISHFIHNNCDLNGRGALTERLIASPVMQASRCKVWKYILLPDYTRVDCGCPRIYPVVDTELYPRGRLWRLPESTPPSQDLPPIIVILWSVFGSQNLPLPLRLYTPLFMCNPPRIYPSLLEYRPTPFSTNLYVRPSQNLPLPPRI